MVQPLHMKLLTTAVFISLIPTGVDAKWDKYEEAIHLISTHPLYQAALKEHHQNISKIYADASPSPFADYTCAHHISESRPDSVHALRMGDVEVIAAMGDSLTAGNGINAKTIIGCLKHYRGYSWSIGGEKPLKLGLQTLPNYFRQNNPDVRGYSMGIGGQDSAAANLNVADQGNVAGNMPRQAKLLVERMKKTPGVDFQNHWKMVTLFIGGNDLCDLCKDRERYGVENYVTNVRKALDLLHIMMPRALVNVVGIFDISPLSEFATGVVCGTINWFVCDCPKKNPSETKITARGFNEAIEKLIMSGRYDTRDDFTVVYQPFMRDNDVPRRPDGSPDMAYFAPDCFHFNHNGHKAMAVMIHNALVEPVGQKRTRTDFTAQITCPAQDQFIATNKNSGF